MKKITIIQKVALICGLLLSSVTAFSIEQLTDSQMSDTTGQDGISIKIAPAASNQTGRLGIGQIVLRDRDGFSAPNAVGGGTIDKTGSGSLWIKMASATGSGIQFCKVAAASCTGTANLSSQAMTIDIDANAATVGGADPSLVVNVNSQADLQAIKLDVASLSLRGGAALSTTTTTTDTFNTLRSTSASEYTFAYLTDGIAIDLNSASSGSSLVVGVTLGSAGAMPGIVLKQADIAKINFGTLKLVNNNAAANATNTLSADISVQNLNLSGSVIDFTSSGVVITKPTVSVGNGFDLNINNVSLGDATYIPVGITEFDGVANGSIGDVRISGVNVTNPRLTIRGL